jgi:uncharacterized protein (TIRG00374 family)
LFARLKGLVYNLGSLPEANALIAKLRPIKLSVREIVSFALTVTAVALLLKQAHPLTILKLLLNSDLSWILLSAALYGFVNIIRSFRLKVLYYDAESKASSFLPLIFVQVFLNNLLPARLGEVAFVYLLKADYEVEWGKGVVLLVGSRLMDYFAVTLLFLATWLLSLSKRNEPLLWALIFSAFLVLLALSLAVVRRLSEPIEKLLTPWEKNKVGKQILTGFRFLVKAPIFHILLPAFTASIVLWVGIFGCFWLILKGLGYGPGFLQVIFGATFSVFSKALPWLTIGGIGAHESGWTVGFMLQGWDKVDAIASGFAVNLFTLLTSAVFGIGGFVWLELARRNSSLR